MKYTHETLSKSVLVMSAMVLLLFGSGSEFTRADEQANLSKTVFYVA